MPPVLAYSGATATLLAVHEASTDHMNDKAILGFDQNMQILRYK